MGQAFKYILNNIFYCFKNFRTETKKINDRDHMIKSSSALSFDHLPLLLQKLCNPKVLQGCICFKTVEELIWFLILFCSVSLKSLTFHSRCMTEDTIKSTFLFNPETIKFFTSSTFRPTGWFVTND